MGEQQQDKSMLSPYRALDLTDEKGFLCGKLLADMGADVIKIEPPEGDPSRDIGPFYHDITDREKSLSWFAYNSNKRGITLNIETSDGQEIFKRLVKTADFVIESFPPGYLDELGVGYFADKWEVSWESYREKPYPLPNIQAWRKRVERHIPLNGRRGLPTTSWLLEIFAIKKETKHD